MPALNELLSRLRFPSDHGITLVTKAFYFAENAHRTQKRSSGDPYFFHVYETAKILAELGLGPRTVSAGLLHDVLEDAQVTPQTIEKEFGLEILFLVQGVTKLGEIRYTGEQRHIESLRKFFVSMSRDLRVLLIKLADRLHNMRTLEHLPPDKRVKIAKETFEIYIPLAYRMGMRHMKRELEDLAFKHIKPDEYTNILKILKEKRADRYKYLEKFHKSTLKLLAVNDVKNIQTDLRLKSTYSLYQKLNTKNREIDKIYDIFALRIMLESVADCYRVLGLIHSVWRPLPGRIKDYISFPKPNGYQSLHTTVFTGDGGIVEVQIRTHQMHQVAEFGFASHIAYKERSSFFNTPGMTWFKQFFPHKKKQTKNPLPNTSHVPQWISQLVDVQSYVNIPTEFMNNLKTDFLEHRIFIFDGKGDVVDLPKGSTPLDFAFAQDSSKALKYYGSKVNGKPVTMDYKLHNGDIVQIITKLTAKPTKNWIDCCKTASARNFFRSYIDVEI